jgi:hypothetical protein
MKAEKGKSQMPNPKPQLEQLRAKLIEDTGSPLEAEQLLSTARRLRDWPAPQPSAQDTAKLLAALQPALPARSSAISHLLSDLRNSWPLLLIHSQLRVVRAEIWTASALVMALGAVVTLALTQPGTGGTLPFVLVAPFVAALGVSFLYGPAVDPALEIELTTPVSPRLVLLARLALVFGFDLILSLVASAALAVVRPDISLWSLVSAWLAPMTFLSALAFLLSVITLDTLHGVAVSLLLWGYQTMRALVPSDSRLPLLALLPNLLAADARWPLFLLAMALSAVALWLAGREERWVNGMAAL